MRETSDNPERAAGTFDPNAPLEPLLEPRKQPRIMFFNVYGFLAQNKAANFIEQPIVVLCKMGQGRLKNRWNAFLSIKPRGGRARIEYLFHGDTFP